MRNKNAIVENKYQWRGICDFYNNFHYILAFSPAMTNSYSLFHSFSLLCSFHFFFFFPFVLVFSEESCFATIERTDLGLGRSLFMRLMAKQRRGCRRTVHPYQRSKIASNTSTFLHTVNDTNGKKRKRLVPVRRMVTTAGGMNS